MIIDNFLTVLRLIKIAFVLAREGVFAAVSPKNLRGLPFWLLCASKLIEKRNSASRERGARVAAALNRLGPSYVKFGQSLAVRPDIIGHELAQDLELLHDQMDAVPLAQIRHLIVNSLQSGYRCNRQEFPFIEISEAIAAASVAQVHKAKITDGNNARWVAVKILRPNIRERFAKDLQGFYLVAQMLESLFPKFRRLAPVSVVDVLANSIKMELDLRLEAAAISEMTQNTQNDQDIYIPEVIWDLTTQEILTMSWIDGIKISDINALQNAGHDLRRLSRLVMQSFLRHAMRDGFFHADMHHGNFFIDKNSKLVIIDFGIMGRLSLKDRRFLAEILHGFISGDYLRVARVHFEAGLVPANEDISAFAQAIRAIGEPIKGRAAKDISMANLLGQLLDYTAVFNMSTQPRLILLQKTMVVAEGVARRLDPELNIWTTAEPIVQEWMQKNYNMTFSGFKKIISKTDIGLQLLHFSKRLDNLISSFEHSAQNGLRLDKQTIVTLRDLKNNRWGQIAIIIIITIACVVMVVD